MPLKAGMPFYSPNNSNFLGVFAMKSYPFLFTQTTTTSYHMYFSVPRLTIFRTMSVDHSTSSASCAQTPSCTSAGGASDKGLLFIGLSCISRSLKVFNPQCPYLKLKGSHALTSRRTCRNSLHSTLAQSTDQSQATADKQRRSCLPR